MQGFQELLKLTLAATNYCNFSMNLRIMEKSSQKALSPIVCLSQRSMHTLSKRVIQRASIVEISRQEDMLGC